jgi:DNA repair protein RadD
MKKSIEPALLELATGAGKSHIVSYIAKWFYEETGKSVLCLAPSKELTEQNHEKYIQAGDMASIYSASAGKKCMRFPVVFGTPGTVKNNINRFGDKFGLVVIDEAHGITPTIQFIIEQMREKNKRLRVIGMTATPYRTTTGYIYRYTITNEALPEDVARDPYFNTLLYKITTNELIDMGFLTPAHADPVHEASYDASKLELNKLGKFDSKEVEQVFEGQGRKTAAIVADVVSHSIGKMGVMIFAATVRHAKEVLDSLPSDNARMIAGDIGTSKKDREQLISDFKNRRFKYLVNVAILTTGFDATHVDVIAILRATESPGLLQQIIGRGLRLHDEKEECLVLDYAENIERHGLVDNLFNPEIKAGPISGGSGDLEVHCDDCGFINYFSSRPNPDNFKISDDGYFLDALGELIETEHGAMPAHYGRRCTGQLIIKGAGVFERCNNRWTSKKCTECEADNDIAARYCCECKAEIVNPNDKLKAEFTRVKKDPYEKSTDKVLEWTATKSISRSGNDILVCEYRSQYRKFKIWYTPESKASEAVHAWRSLNKAVFSGHVAPDVDTFIRHISKGKQPETITCYRKRGTDFYKVIAHNLPEDTL